MKQKNPDNLDLDVRRAQLLGYGIHYGRYKADHPNTKQYASETAEPQDCSKTRVCPVCGKRFPIGKRQGCKRYCSNECYQEHGRQYARQRYYDLKSQQGGMEDKC